MSETPSTEGPSFYKGIELLPTGTKIRLFDEVWTLTQESKRYRLDYKGGKCNGKTYISFIKTDILKRNIVT